MMKTPPVSPFVITGATNAPAPVAPSGAAQSGPALASPQPSGQTLQLSPLQERIAATTLHDDQSRIALLQMADDATHGLSAILSQMKGLVTQIGDASLNTATRSLAQQQFNGLANRLNDVTAHARHAAGGSDTTQLGSAIAVMASALTAVTANYSSSIIADSANAAVGDDAVYITALSEALNSVSVVRMMLLASAQNLSQPDPAAPTMSLAISTDDLNEGVGYVSQGVNIGIDQALTEAGSGVLKDASTISAFVTFLLQGGAT